MNASTADSFPGSTLQPHLHLRPEVGDDEVVGRLQRGRRVRERPRVANPSLGAHHSSGTHPSVDMVGSVRSITSSRTREIVMLSDACPGSLSYA
jgi:hypothetical protein